jgi:tRNA (Thr-GGU) A37 N-methylase
VRSPNKIEGHPIGFVRRQHPNEDINDRDLISRIIIRKEYSKGLDGIEDWSHLYVIFWMHEILDEKKTLMCPRNEPDIPVVGILPPELQFAPILLA